MTVGPYYKRPQMESQYFPESYFSGSDVTIYFDDMWMDDVTDLSFTLYENVQPIYGYQSHTFDYAARGNRIVQGQFAIAFREAGYLYRAFNRIAQNGYASRPMLSYKIDNKEVPAWIAGAKTRMEQTYMTVAPQEGQTQNVHPDYQMDFAEYEKQVWGMDDDPSDPKSLDTYFYNKTTQQWMKADGFDIYVNYGNLPHDVKKRNGYVPDALQFPNTVKALRNVQIQATGQILGANGEPIKETYSFIARDLD